MCIRDRVIHADRIIVMDEGEIVMEGVPEEIFSRVEELKKYRLDVPQVTELAYELRKKGVPMRPCILTVEEFVTEIMDTYRKHSE